MRTFEEIENDLDHAHSINDTEAMLRCARELDALATPQAEALARKYRGWTLFLRGDFPAALDHYNHALALYKDLESRSGIAAILCNIGSVDTSTGDYSAALEHYHHALAIHHDLGERRAVARVTGNIGNVHRSTGDYPEALECYHRALELHEELGEVSAVARVTSNIGIVYLNTNDYPEALAHYHRALALHEELGNRSGVAIVTGNIGLVHRKIFDYPAALEYYHRALALHEELGERGAMAIVIGNIGLVHKDTGNYHAALEYHRCALALHEELGDRSGTARVKENILSTYVDMGSDAEATALLQDMDTAYIDDPVLRSNSELMRAMLQERSGDVDGAVMTLRRALSDADTHGLREQSANMHYTLRDLAQKRNDFAGYIEHNNEFTRITEEINGKDTATKLATQAKQREIDSREREFAQHMAVLHSTLPKHIADRVARGEVVNDSFDNAAVLFLDVAGFTTNSSALDASMVVELLQDIFTTFDAICEQHDVMKIKTIGDSYMAVAFETANVMPSGVEAQRTANVMPSGVEAQRTANVMPSGVEAQRTANSVRHAERSLSCRREDRGTTNSEQRTANSECGAGHDVECVHMATHQRTCDVPHRTSLWSGSCGGTRHTAHAV
ncbi:MAG: tetratricopeptide repeat protein [Ignavibacteria bacterium]|nr:tetratricopeptide repeat protein [Ignavibacteria bacterium]